MLEFLRRMLARWVARAEPREEPAETHSAPSSEAAPGPRRKAKARAARRPAHGRAEAGDPGAATAATRNLRRSRRLVSDAFTPVHPVTSRAHFAGRREVLRSIIDAVEEQRAHIVVFGERGIGKTSLMHVLAELARESGYLVVYGSCGNRSGFDEMFRSLLRNIPLNNLPETMPVMPNNGATLADRLPEGPVNARELSEICASISGISVLIILDEYDRVEAEEFRQATAELMKNLSDRAARVQLVLAGVSSNIRELIGHIPSIRRNIVGIPVPRFSDDEVRALIGDGERTAGVEFAEAVVSKIIMLANGSPYLVRLISHHASLLAIDSGRLAIGDDDLVAALDKVLAEAEQRLPSKLVRRIEQWCAQNGEELIVAAARAANSADGWFAADDVTRQLGEAVRPDLVSRLTAEEILESDPGEGEERYRFRDEALAPFIWLTAARRQLEAEQPGPVRNAAR